MNLPEAVCEVGMCGSETDKVVNTGDLQEVGECVCVCVCNNNNKTNNNAILQVLSSPELNAALFRLMKTSVNELRAVRPALI